MSAAMAIPLLNHPPILFLHIGWAREYRALPDDPVQGKFGYFLEGNENVGEASNFKDFDGRCFGFAAHWTVALAKLGGSKLDDHVDGVLVVWTAQSPAGDGRFIVGWYRNATVFSGLRAIRPDEDRPDILTSAAATDCHLVPEDERSFSVPSMRAGWPGIARAWYANEHLTGSQVERLFAYINDGVPSNGFLEGRETAEPDTGDRGTVSPELRKQVELAAEDAVVTYYEARGWKVERVGDQNLGWDLDVRQGARRLRVEVKGRGGRGAVELTPNEYRAMNDVKLRMSYHLAVVFDTLSNPQVTIFRYISGDDAWHSDAGDVLKLREMMGAIASF